MHVSAVSVGARLPSGNTIDCPLGAYGHSMNVVRVFLKEILSRALAAERQLDRLSRRLHGSLTSGLWGLVDLLLGLQACTAMLVMPIYILRASSGVVMN